MGPFAKWRLLAPGPSPPMRRPTARRHGNRNHAGFVEASGRHPPGGVAGRISTHVEEGLRRRGPVGLIHARSSAPNPTTSARAIDRVDGRPGRQPSPPSPADLGRPSPTPRRHPRVPPGRSTAHGGPSPPGHGRSTRLRARPGSRPARRRASSPGHHPPAVCQIGCRGIRARGSRRNTGLSCPQDPCQIEYTLLDAARRPGVARPTF